MRIVRPATILVACLLHGCAEIPRLTEADAKTWGTRFDDLTACRYAAPDKRIEPAFRSSKDLEVIEHNRGLWIEEVRRRKLLTDLEWRLVAERTIQVGMSRCAMYLSWGRPFRENRTVVGQAEHIQHVYSRHLVYTYNDKVTAWQDSNR